MFLENFNSIIYLQILAASVAHTWLFHNFNETINSTHSRTQGETHISLSRYSALPCPSNRIQCYIKFRRPVLSLLIMADQRLQIIHLTHGKM